MANIAISEVSGYYYYLFIIFAACLLKKHFGALWHICGGGSDPLGNIKAPCNENIISIC